MILWLVWVFKTPADKDKKIRKIYMNKKNANSKNAFVTIVGRANAGKSSLLNALVGEKIAAVSDKPQTTRTKITGVLTNGETQFVFMDTPGMHKAKTSFPSICSTL